MTTKTNNPMMSLVLAVAASAAMLSFVATPAEAKSVPVQVSSHELATPAGRSHVEGRVQSAAKQACAVDSVDWRSAAERRAYDTCVKAAVADAVAQIALISSRAQLASR